MPCTSSSVDIYYENNAGVKSLRVHQSNEVIWCPPDGSQITFNFKTEINDPPLPDLTDAVTITQYMVMPWQSVDTAFDVGHNANCGRVIQVRANNALTCQVRVPRKRSVYKYTLEAGGLDYDPVIIIEPPAQQVFFLPLLSFALAAVGSLFAIFLYRKFWARG